MRRAKLTAGVLRDCYEKVRENLFQKLDPAVHAQTYVGLHDPYYAEPEFTGKYLDICMQYHLESGDPAPLESARRVIESIRANQREDGYLGTFEPGTELAVFSIWNQSFTINGIISYWDVTGDEEALRLAIRCADFIAGQFLCDNPPDILDAINDGSENLVVLLAFARLYQRTGNPRYRAFIDWMLDYLEKTDMNLISFSDLLKLRSRKGIEMLLAYLALIQYGEITQDGLLIEAAERYWRQINDTQIRETGNATIAEFWTKDGNAPANLPLEAKPSENCVAVGWSELTLMLFFQSPEARYLDAFEKTLFNHILGALARDGRDFSYYQGNFGKKVFRKEARYYQCCRYRGLTLFAHLQELLYHFDGRALIPMVYASSECSIEPGGVPVRVLQETDYPVKGGVRFTVDAQADARFILKLRVPEWCPRASVSVDGVAYGEPAVDGFIPVHLMWRAGRTEVALDLEMPAKTRVAGIDGVEHAAVQYGPLLLALDSHFGAPIDSTRIWLESGQATPRREQPDKDASLVMFSCDGEVNGLPARLTLVDYASAGSIDYARDAFRVWIPVFDRADKEKGGEPSI